MYIIGCLCLSVLEIKVQATVNQLFSWPLCRYFPLYHFNFWSNFIPLTLNSLRVDLLFWFSYCDSLTHYICLVPLLVCYHSDPSQWMYVKTHLAPSDIFVVEERQTKKERRNTTETLLWLRCLRQPCNYGIVQHGPFILCLLLEMLKVRLKTLD